MKNSSFTLARELESKIQLNFQRKSEIFTELNGEAIHTSKHLRDVLVKMLEIPRAERECKEIERRLWKSCFYLFIDMFRKELLNFLKKKSDKDNNHNSIIVNMEKKFDDFEMFLSEARSFYERLLEQSTLSENSKYRCLVCLGDITRYKQLHSRRVHGNKMTRSRFAESEKYYDRALRLQTSFGSAHNQLAVLATYRNENIVAAYHYVRALYTRIPFATAFSNLKTVFYRTMQKDKSKSARKKSKLQRCMQRLLDMNATLFFASESRKEKKTELDPKLLLATRKRLRTRLEELLGLKEEDGNSTTTTTTTNTRDRLQTIVSTSAFLDKLMTISMFTHQRSREAWANASFSEGPYLEIIYAHAHIIMCDIASVAALKIREIGNDEKTNRKCSEQTRKKCKIARRHLLRTLRLYCQWLSADPKHRVSPKIFSGEEDARSDKTIAALIDVLYDSQEKWWASLSDSCNVLLDSSSSSMESSTERIVVSSSETTSEATSSSTNHQSWTFHNLTLLDRVIDDEDVSSYSHHESTTTMENAIEKRSKNIQDHHARYVLRFAARSTSSKIRKLFIVRNKSGLPRLTSKFSVDQQPYCHSNPDTDTSLTTISGSQPSPVLRKRKRLDEKFSQEANRKRAKNEDHDNIENARQAVYENEITTKKMKDICDSNPHDTIFIAAYEHAKEILRTSIYELESLGMKKTEVNDN